MAHEKISKKQKDERNAAIRGKQDGVCTGDLQVDTISHGMLAYLICDLSQQYRFPWWTIIF